MISKNMLTRDQAFTLIELLVVLAIIAIIVGIFGNNLVRSIRAAELREATSNFASDLRRVRSLAQRGSTDQVVSWTRATQENTGYTLPGKAMSLPNNITLMCTTGCSTSPTVNSLTYQAPYGELSRPQGYVFELKSPLNSVAPMQVKVVGITGKIIVTSGGS